MKSLFLSHQNAMVPGGGGQQQCTREYRELLRNAGFELTDVTYDTDRTLGARLRRKVRPAPYANMLPSEFLSRVASVVQDQEPGFVFCNLYNFVPFGPKLRKELPAHTKLVLLSHGLASVDEVHAARIARCQVGSTHMPREIPDDWIGKMLRVECECLPAFNHIFCLAPFEVEICRWLGAESVSWLPRTLRSNRLLSMTPSGDRVGIVGTIDHPPNLEGAELFCAALKAAGPGKLRLRLVTSSAAVAADLAKRYPFVDNLGPILGPGAVEAEVATWSAFVHPIFCYAMGCSTKVATGLNWGLPVLTTAAGLRGYTWKRGNIPVSNSPAELARAAIASLDLERCTTLREEILKVVHSAPDIPEVSAQIRRDLGIA